MQVENTYRHILGIALPIILSSLAEQLINLTDTIVVGRNLGEISLGAVGLGNLFYYTFIFIAVGMGTGAQILIGRRNGEKNYREIGRLFDNSLYLFTAIALGLFLVLFFASPALLRYCVSDDEVYRQTLSYVNIRQYGTLFTSLAIVHRIFYIGITKTRVILGITTGMVLINFIFNQLLVRGLYGFPALHISGSALASVIAEGCALTGYIIYTLRRPKNAKYHLYTFPRADKSLINAILRTGLPIMLQGWVSISSWFLFFILIENQGPRPLAVSQILKNLYMLLMLPVWGFGSTTNTLVSNAMGSERIGEVYPIIRRVITISLGSVAVMALACFIFPDSFISLFTKDPALIALAREPLYLVAVACVFFAIGFIYFNAVSGSGATRVSLIIEISVLLVYVSYIYIVTRTPHVPLSRVWFAEVLYMLLMGIMSLLYLRTGKWKKIKV